MQIIIDEGVSESSPLFSSFLKLLGNQAGDFLFLSKAHPGIPDIEIIDKLLPKYRNLLTRDKVLHNHAIAKGFNSFTLDNNGKLTKKPLANVKIKNKDVPSVRKKLETTYFLMPSEEIRKITHRLLDTFSQNDIERIRTKRRRIRSHFNDVANISSIDFTIGSERNSKGVIGGFFLKVNAKQSLKALKHASEGYCLDQISAHILSPIFYALTHLYCLHLSHIRTTLYITSSQALEICQNLKSGGIGDGSIERGVKLMLQSLPNVELMPCVKGPFFDQMQNKLNLIKRKGTNELVSLDFKAITKHLLEDKE